MKLVSTWPTRAVSGLVSWCLSGYTQPNTALYGQMGTNLVMYKHCNAIACHFGDPIYDRGPFLSAAVPSSPLWSGTVSNALPVAWKRPIGSLRDSSHCGGSAMRSPNQRKPPQKVLPSVPHLIETPLAEPSTRRKIHSAQFYPRKKVVLINNPRICSLCNIHFNKTLLKSCTR